MMRRQSQPKTRDKARKQRFDLMSPAVAVPQPAPRPVEELFSGPRPASFSRSLEPAFLLIDRTVMDQLRAKATALGIGGYDGLVKRILREHIEEY